MAKSKPVMNINDLVPDARNANKGTQRGRGMVEASLREVGAVVFVVSLVIAMIAVGMGE